MRVLAIDPGFGRCGVAIVERRNGKEAWIHSDCIETQAGQPFAVRLAHVVSACERLIATHEPDALAMERLFFKANRTTAMHVAEVRGALINAATAAGLPVFEYTPAEVKSATTGSGRADKKQVAAMIHLLVAVGKPVKHDDEYDAIAVGITHLARTR